MKKVILSLVFLLATGTSFMNASSTKEILKTTNETIETAESFSCLMDAYHWANALEKDSYTGKWTTKQWAHVMNVYFDLCNNLPENRW